MDQPTQVGPPWATSVDATGFALKGCAQRPPDKDCCLECLFLEVLPVKGDHGQSSNDCQPWKRRRTNMSQPSRLGVLMAGLPSPGIPTDQLQARRHPDSGPRSWVLIALCTRRGSAKPLAHTKAQRTAWLSRQEGRQGAC